MSTARVRSHGPRRADRTRRSRLIMGTMLAVTVINGCGGGTVEAPTAGTFRGFPPDLRGRRVMVFPVQIRTGVRDDADPEIAFAFRERSDEVEWIFPEELEAVLARAPGIPTRVRGLPVGQFLRSEVRRVGDPLYGQLRRLGEMTRSEVAFIPVQIRVGPDEAGEGSAVEIVSTILNVRSGRVVWFGVVAGNPGPLTDFASIASAVENLAATLLWYGR